MGSQKQSFEQGQTYWPRKKDKKSTLRRTLNAVFWKVSNSCSDSYSTSGTHRQHVWNSRANNVWTYMTHLTV